MSEFPKSGDRVRVAIYFPHQIGVVVGIDHGPARLVMVHFAGSQNPARGDDVWYFARYELLGVKREEG